MNSSRDKSGMNKHQKTIGGHVIYGSLIDIQTRCKHYHSPVDIIAIKFRCCQLYFPCFECHREAADHVAETWPAEQWEHKAVLCGACGHEMSIHEYMKCDNRCPSCQSSFNPNCANHYHLYFSQY